MSDKKNTYLNEPALVGGSSNFKPVASILILAWPVIIEMGLHTFVWIFDTAMVMRLGAHEATAVEYGAIVLFNSLMVLGALGIGANALVARYTGANDMNRAALVGGQALSVSLLITAIFTVISLLFYNAFFGWVIQDPVTVGLAKEYFYYALTSGGYALLPLVVASGIIRGIGNTRVPMIIALIFNLYNVIGDYLLIFGNFGFPALGVKGAALATGSAQLIGLALSLGYLLFHKGILPFSLRSLFPWDLDALKQVLKLSIPAGAEELTHSGSRMLSASWIIFLGPVAFAANAAAIAAEAFSFMPGHAFAIAATTLVGQRLGAGFIKQARETGYWAVALGTILMSLFGLIFFFFPYLVMSLFDPPDPEVLRLGVLCLQIAAVEQPFIALTMVFSGALKGTGDTKGPFKIGLYTNLFIRLPLIYAVVFIFNLEIYYIWWITAIQFAVSALLLYIRYRKKDWNALEPIPTLENIG
ncbi:MAG: MATE family efflux transporter [Bacillota bacterium]|nr:MATE family efflux transporter [Bacillota bacterium]